jgi:hypothetical protein
MRLYGSARGAISDGHPYRDNILGAHFDANVGFPENAPHP